MVSDKILERQKGMRKVAKKSETKDEKNMRERFEGCLVGLACGDALGAPIEFLNLQMIAQKLGILGTVREMVGGGWLNLNPGEYTDDMDMMLCIAESLAETNGYNPDDIAKRFVDWYKSNPKDIGNTTRGSLAKIASGVPWQRAGDPVSPANGSVMRCAPIGLMFAFDEKKLIEASIETSAMTHASSDATASCVLINLMISKLVLGEDRQKAFFDCIEILKKTDKTYVDKFFDTFPRPAPVIDISKGLASNAVILSISSLIGSFSFEQAIVSVVNLGGDADTNGAVTGALAGAYWGISAIPERWSSKLNPYSADKIRELADKIFDLAIKQK